MTTSKRAVTESPLYQGTSESIAYGFNFATLGTPTSSPGVQLWNMNSGAACTGTGYLNGTSSLSAGTVTTPYVLGLSVGVRYRLVCQAVINSATISNYCDLIGEL